MSERYTARYHAEALVIYSRRFGGRFGVKALREGELANQPRDELVLRPDTILSIDGHTVDRVSLQDWFVDKWSIQLEIECERGRHGAISVARFTSP